MKVLRARFVIISRTEAISIVKLSMEKKLSFHFTAIKSILNLEHEHKKKTCDAILY